MNIFEWKGPYLSIYERVFWPDARPRFITTMDQLNDGNCQSSSQSIENIRHLRSVLGDCKSGNLPDYSFVEPITTITTATVAQKSLLTSTPITTSNTARFHQ